MDELKLSQDFIKNVAEKSIENSAIGIVTMKDIGLSQALKDFYTANYYPGYILSQSDIFNWQFKNNGGKAAVLLDSDKVIAHQGHVPVVFTDGLNDYRGFISASTMVDKNYRRKGLMSVLRGSVQDRYEMASSIGGSDLGIKLYSSMGYRHLGFMFRMVAVHNPSLCGEVAKNSDILQKTFSLNEEKNDNIKSIENFLDHSDAIENLRNAVFTPGKYFGVKRDADFLQWRYAQHPAFKYQRFGLWDKGSLKALIVFRIENVANTNSQVIRITELIGNDDNLIHIVKATVFSKEISENIAWIDWFTTNKAICEAIKGSGFKYQEEIKATLPIFCSPIDYSKHSYPVMFWSRDEKKYNLLPPLDQWYLTKGDGDADRPNTAQGYKRED